MTLRHDDAYPAKLLIINRIENAKGKLQFIFLMKPLNFHKAEGGRKNFVFFC
jgi:hypothetical protein